MEQLQSHIWLTAASYMVKYFRISLYIRKPFSIFDFATAPLRISLFMRQIFFVFISVNTDGESAPAGDNAVGSRLSLEEGGGQRYGLHKVRPLQRGGQLKQRHSRRGAIHLRTF